MKATITDVADRAGVSVATVSRVVNGNYPVRRATRARVETAIAALSYVPNIQARELNMQRSSSIGVVVPGFENMFFAEVLKGIEDRLRQSSYSLLLACAENDSAQEKRCVMDLLARNASGVIVVSPNTETIASDFYADTAGRLPLVFINSYERVPGISYVTSDERGGTRIALEYLLRCGHGRILFVRGEKSDSYRIKEEVYRAIMQEPGTFSEADILNIGAGNSLETVDHTMRALMRRMEKGAVTAVFCCNDMMGAGAVNACKRMGRRVPEDIAVVGYDNTSLSRFIEPKLTTIDQRMAELGAAAAQLMLEKINRETTRDILLENRLVERETTSCRAK